MRPVHLSRRLWWTAVAFGYAVARAVCSGRFAVRQNHRIGYEVREENAHCAVRNTNVPDISGAIAQARFRVFSRNGPGAAQGSSRAINGHIS